jgi:hypothetical protein
LIGTKYDTFASFPRDEQEEITKQAKRFSKAMHAPLVSVNVWRPLIASDLLLNLTLDQRSKDLQNRLGQGFRAQSKLTPYRRSYCQRVR